MNAMGHDVPTMIGVDPSGLTEKINALVPDYMAMGQRGMADMAEMPMPLPANTLPMMTGQGPFGGIEMGGMFSVFKVRSDQPAGDYSDPGWYQHPADTVAKLWQQPLPEPARPASVAPAAEVELTVKKPGQHHHSTTTGK